MPVQVSRIGIHGAGVEEYGVACLDEALQIHNGTGDLCLNAGRFLKAIKEGNEVRPIGNELFRRLAHGFGVILQLLEGGAHANAVIQPQFHILVATSLRRGVEVQQILHMVAEDLRILTEELS